MKRFDMAFSMGFSCGGTMALRRAGLQFASYPLDWIGAPGIVASARMIASDFAGWFEKEDLQLVAVRGGSFQNNVYQNRRTRFGFPHDFPRFFRFEEKYPETAEKYARRIRRFMGELGVAKTALVVYIERPINSRATDADVQAAYFRGRFEVPDRRSEEEKAAYARERRSKRKQQFGGKLNALKYRLYRWLERDLQEKGLVPRDFPLWFD